MLDQFNRWIRFHSLNMAVKPDHAPDFEEADVLQLITSFASKVKGDEAIMMMDNETASLRVADLRFCEEGKFVVMVMQYANTKATDPVFLNLEKRQLRTVTKLEGEGVAVSGHIMIGLKQKSDGTYPCLVEDVPGLGKTNLQKFFRKAFKEEAEGYFIFPDEEKQGKDRKYRPFAEILDDPSTKFEEDIKAGLIQGVELVKISKRGTGQFDEPGFFYEDVSVVKIKAEDSSDKFQWLNRLKNKAKQEGFSSMKIRYKKTDGKQKTALMGTSIKDVASAAIVRLEKIVSRSPLPQCDDVLNSNISDEMSKYI